MHILNSLNYIPEYNIFLPDEKINFKFLKQRIKKFSQFFLLQNIRNCRICIFLPKGAEATIAILSVLYSGNTYVPFNPEDPIERISYMLENVSAYGVIGKGSRPRWLKESYQWIDISSDFGQVDKALFQPLKANIACIFHTSGSTGTPKGVALSHEAILAFSNWARETFSVSSMDIIASLSPFSFDLSTFDLFTTLSSGAKVRFIPPNLTMNPSKFCSWFLRNGITLWYTVPSFLTFLVNKGDLSSLRESSIRAILFAGEPIPYQTLSILVENLPDIEFYNLYGPIEANVIAYWKVNLEKFNNIPIGIPASKARLKINKKNQELLVKGPSLMSGYWSNSLQPHKGWFRTGDIVEKNENGLLIYKGRLNRMFKFQGYRIEPVEIEAAAQKYPDIVVGVAELIKNQIVLSVSIKRILEINKFMGFLSTLLPSYMLPSKILVFDKIPVLTNGKIDFLSARTQAEEKLKEEVSKYKIELLL
jgi:acyl-coenzyme A synthetase/AMP-(fatty) acid ligase